MGLLLGLVLGMTGWGCGSKTSNNQQVFTYNQVEGLPTLDPAFTKNQATMWVAHQLFNTLVEVDSNLSIVPSLATRWQISKDRLTYTFYLRSNVFFSRRSFVYKWQGQADDGSRCSV